MRLDHLVCSTWHLRKADAQRLIRDRRVRVQPLGLCPTNPSFQVVLGAEVIELSEVGDGPTDSIAAMPVARPFHSLIVMNKPPGYNCERPRSRQPRQRQQKQGPRDSHCVYDLVPSSLAHASLGTFGRLDKDTTGLLLLGSDGGLQALMTHPSSGLCKKYVAIIKAGAAEASISAHWNGSLGGTRPEGHGVNDEPVASMHELKHQAFAQKQIHR